MTPSQVATTTGSTSLRLVAGGVLACLALTGCATGGGTAGQSSPTPRADLAATAEAAPRNVEQHPAGHKRTAGKATGGEASAGGPGDERGKGRPVGDRVAGSPGPGGPAAEPASWRPVALATDASGDHGDGPSYADLTSLNLEDDGTNLRVTVELGGTVPARLADGEVQGVGVDVYRLSGRESDFQVFLDGGADGWRGYLQTPRGFVKYPGTLALDGGTLVTVIPWAALGGPEDAQVSAFSDWSNRLGTTSADSVDRRPMHVG